VTSNKSVAESSKLFTQNLFDYSIVVVMFSIVEITEELFSCMVARGEASLMGKLGKQGDLSLV